MNIFQNSSQILQTRFNVSTVFGSKLWIYALETKISEVTMWLKVLSISQCFWSNQDTSRVLPLCTELIWTSETFSIWLWGRLLILLNFNWHTKLCDLYLNWNDMKMNFLLNQLKTTMKINLILIILFKRTDFYCHEINEIGFSKKMLFIWNIQVNLNQSIKSDLVNFLF